MNNVQLLDTGFIKEVWNYAYEDEVDDSDIYDSLTDFIDKNNLISLSYHPHLATEDTVFEDSDMDADNFEFNEDSDTLDYENLTIYKLKGLDIYFSVIGGDWQTPTNIVFKYSKEHGILPLLYFQNLHEKRD